MSAELRETTVVHQDGSKTTLVNKGNGWVIVDEQLGEYPADFQIGMPSSDRLTYQIEDLYDLLRAACGLTD